MDCKPLVSVIMPTYNREKIISRAIDSIFKQTYSNWELIVSDDGSTDNTAVLIKQYARDDYRIKYISRDKNSGPSAARNFGIAKSKGKYLAFLDSDDEWAPHHLNECIGILEREDVEATISLWCENKSGELYAIDTPYEGKDYLKLAIEKLKPIIKDKFHFMGPDFFKFALLEYFFFNHINTLVLKKDIIEKIGLFNEKLFLCEDLDFLFRVYIDSKVCFIKDYHFIYNHGTGNIYAFIDRNNMDMEVLAKDKKAVIKFTKAEMYKIILRKLWLKRVRKRKGLEDKKECIDGLKKYMAEKYFTLGYLNRKVRKLRSMMYYINSLIFEFSFAKIVFAGRIFSPFLFNKFKVKKPTFNFW